MEEQHYFSLLLLWGITEALRTHHIVFKDGAIIFTVADQTLPFLVNHLIEVDLDLVLQKVLGRYVFDPEAWDVHAVLL